MTTKKLMKLHSLLEQCKEEHTEHFQDNGDQAMRMVDSTICFIIVKKQMGKRMKSNK